MKVMVPRWTLTWITVDLDTKEVGPARVYGTSENLVRHDEGPEGVLTHADNIDDELTLRQQVDAVKLVDDCEHELTFEWMK